MSKKKPKSKKIKKPKVKRPRAEESANPRKELVDSPYGLGFDKVHRVVDTVDDMKKRRQLSERQYDAAVKYRASYLKCHGSIKSALNDSGSGGVAPGSRTPDPSMLMAADILAIAKRILGTRDGLVVEMIAGQGCTIQEVTVLNNGVGENGRPRPDDLRAIGKRFREGLDLMAMEWFGADRKAHHDTFIPDWAKTTNITVSGELERKPAAAHAGHDARGKFKLRGR